MSKLVSERHKLLVDDNAQARAGPRERIEQNLCQGRELRGAVPPVAAVHQAALSFVAEQVGDEVGTDDDLPNVREVFRRFQLDHEIFAFVRVACRGGEKCWITNSDSDFDSYFAYDC